MDELSRSLAIAGAGIVGLSCAVWAMSRGWRVLLLDGNAPGSGASFGNAGTIATYACVPVNSPTLAKRLPALLFSAESPLAIDAAYAWRNRSWVLRFIRNCTRDRVEAITDHLGELLSHADAGLNPLLARASANDLLVSNDCLYLYSSPCSYNSAAREIEARQRNGVRLEILSGDQVRELEPAIRAPIYRGLRFNGARHVRDPLALVLRLFDHFRATGGEWLEQHVSHVCPQPGGVTLTLADGSTRRASHLVVAAGAHSASIVGSGAERLPLDTERGYHIIYRHHGNRLSRPVGWADAGLYATPMSMGLRIAGTVELAGLHKRASRSRIAYLERKARELFADLGAVDEEWLGFRPTLPDSLPVIGRSTVSDRILLAFGHQHIGLTLGGITGRIIADLADGRAPNLDIAPYSPDRF